MSRRWAVSEVLDAGGHLVEIAGQFRKFVAPAAEGRGGAHAGAQVAARQPARRRLQPAHGCDDVARQPVANQRGGHQRGGEVAATPGRRRQQQTGTGHRHEEHVGTSAARAAGRDAP